MPWELPASSASSGNLPKVEISYGGLMQHRRYYITDLTLSGQILDGRGGDLIVAKRGESPDIDWELVFQTKEPTPIEQSPYRLLMDGPEGELSGAAVLVRSDGTSHVFRGAGDLDGFTVDMFEN